MTGTALPSSTRKRWKLRFDGVFWRTFLLIALLISASLGAWLQSFRVFERGPRAEQTAQTIVSVVNVTRAALVHSDPEKRRALLIDLARNEGIRIYPLETTDVVEPMPESSFMKLAETAVRAKLGGATRMSLRVNGRAGVWVNFAIDDDAYWVAFDPDRVDVVDRLQWLGWGAIALAFSLVGAVAISRLINLPLRRLTAATLALGRGRRPVQLPDVGPREIREANVSFNAMVQELERVETDRALLLAGISHDLRTPLTRLRLEIEMSAPDEATRDAMVADVEQIDSIIGQFLDYARPLTDGVGLSDLPLGALVRQVLTDLPPQDGLALQSEIHSDKLVRGQPTELKRVVLNLVENARRYARPDDGGPVHVDVAVRDQGADVILEVMDRGAGIDPNQAENLKRPFTRMDSARSNASGSGLGLAIVNRIAERHHAAFHLLPREGGGLTARLVFPVAV